MVHAHVGDLHRGGLEVVHEGGGLQVPLLVIVELFVQRRADAVGGSPLHQPLHDGRIEHGAAVVHHAVLEDGDAAGVRVHFHDDPVRGVAGEELVPHPAVLVGHIGDVRLVIEPALQTGLHVRRQRQQVAVGHEGQLAEGLPVLMTVPGTHAAFGQFQILRRFLQQVGCQLQQLAAHLARGAEDGAHVGARELVGVVTGGVEPGRHRGVEERRHPDCVHGHSQLVGDDLCGGGLMPLPAAHVAQEHQDAAVVLHPHHGRLRRARGAPPAGRENVRRRVGGAGLQPDGDADAEVPSLCTGLLLLLEKRLIVDERQQLVQGAAEVAAVDQRPAGAGVRHGVRRHQVLPPQFDTVHAELSGQVIHHPLHGQAHERLADAPVGAGRALVGHHRVDLVAHHRDSVAVGQVPELQDRVDGGVQDIGPLVGDVPHLHSQDMPLAVQRRLDIHDAVAGVDERHQVLAAVLQVLHRLAAAQLRQQGGDDQVLGLPLVAEAAPDVRGDETDLGMGEAQAVGDDGHGLTGPLVVGPDGELLPAMIVDGGAAEGFEGGGRVPLDVEALLQDVRRPAESLVHVAVLEAVLPHDVGAHGLEQQRRIRLHGRLGVHRRGQRLVLHPDLLQRVFRQVTAGGQDGGHRLAHMGHLPIGQAIGVELNGNGDEGAKRLGHAPRLLSGEAAHHAGHLERLAQVHAQDARVGVDAPQQRDMVHVGELHVVDVHAPAGGESQILAQRNRLALPLRG